MDRAALDLIDRLIAGWWNRGNHREDGLRRLADRIMYPGGSAALSRVEKAIVAQLRPLLSKEEWSQLPELLIQRNRPEIREEAERREALERIRRRNEEERKRREVEEERDRRARERLEAEEAFLARKRAVVARLKDAFESDFLAADEAHAAGPDAALVTADDYEQLKIGFVQDWANRTLPSAALDFEQAGAIAATGGDIQVVARAGSGKTRTLVTRAIFLQKHCRVSPRELLLLAFNKEAAEEMKSRLAQTLGEDLPHVMTFHALAYALVHPEEDLVFDDAGANQLGLSREVQEVIDEHIRSEELGDRIRDLMLAHFREDWERIVDGRFQLTMDEFLAHRRALPRESLRGDYVKSFGEKVIANALFEHGVEYRYERNFRWNGINYRPDFTIPIGPRGGVIIEYFGFQGDADYDQMSEQKRRFWAERDEWTFLEFSPRDLAESDQDGFVQVLLQKLGKAGVSCVRRSEEEIWELIRERALDSFTAAMRTFIGRCRKRNLSPTELELVVAGHASCSTAEALFLDVGISVYRSYLERLAATGREDFDGLAWRAVSLVREGQTRFV